MLKVVKMGTFGRLPKAQVWQNDQRYKPILRVKLEGTEKNENPHQIMSQVDKLSQLISPRGLKTDRISFTLTYHPQNLAIKNVILKSFKILRNVPETKNIFSLPPLISF